MCGFDIHEKTITFANRSVSSTTNTARKKKYDKYIFWGKVILFEIYSI